MSSEKTVDRDTVEQQIMRWFNAGLLSDIDNAQLCKIFNAISLGTYCVPDGSSITHGNCCNETQEIWS